MRQAFLAGVLFLVFGVASFMYRNLVERPAPVLPVPACAGDTLTCPDGRVLRRESPSCAFPACLAAPATTTPQATSTPTVTPVVPSALY
jgi:hypothetical protein